MTADVFTVMPHEAREAFVPEYMAFLRETEGTPNLETKTLPRREEFFRSLPGISIATPLVDPGVFARNVTQRAPEPGLDRRMLWALSVAKANRAERFGIDFKLRFKGFEKAGADDPYTFVELQELYHTKIFISVLKTIGIEADILPPSGFTRMVVMAAGGLPHAMSDVIALAAEIAGVAAFRLLREEAGKLFEGEVRARIEMLFTQILKDEVGHVRFLRSRLGPVRLAIARTLLPLVTRGMLDDLPELIELLGRDRFLAEVQRANLQN
jgi:hypothetical protein